MKVDRIKAKVDREELAWTAGFFDGEGSVIVHRDQSGRIAPRISVMQADPEPMWRMKLALFGLGRVSGPYDRGPNRKVIWTFRIDRWRDVQAAIVAMWPFLGTPKRRQALDALTRFKEQGVLRIGRVPWETCARGHNEWHTPPNGPRYCNPCATIHQRNRRARRAAERRTA